MTCSPALHGSSHGYRPIPALGASPLGSPPGVSAQPWSCEVGRGEGARRAPTHPLSHLLPVLGTSCRPSPEGAGKAPPPWVHSPAATLGLNQALRTHSRTSTQPSCGLAGSSRAAWLHQVHLGDTLLRSAGKITDSLFTPRLLPHPVCINSNVLPLMSPRRNGSLGQLIGAGQKQEALSSPPPPTTCPSRATVSRSQQGLHCCIARVCYAWHWPPEGTVAFPLLWAPESRRCA